MNIRDTRPWFWILVAALSVVAIGALVIAVSANNESVDQKKIAEEASNHVVAKVAGLDQAVEAADELQAEGKERSEADREQIQKDVEEAVDDGQAELAKVRRRVGHVEDELAAQTKAGHRLEKQVAGLTDEQDESDAEVKSLSEEVTELEEQVKEVSKAAKP